ncbi:hypothetical protein, partial [Nocardia asiatica]|uniref:hypothetical protein n=1 Tax=Nocardia asiatica TaxID=209252 RepID=UPI002458C959
LGYALSSFSDYLRMHAPDLLPATRFEQGGAPGKPRPRTPGVTAGPAPRRAGAPPPPPAPPPPHRPPVPGAPPGGPGGGATRPPRLTGTAERARTVTLLSIVGAQLGETAVLRPTDPVVVGAAAVSAAALLGIVETPGLSQLFGCRPVGPVGLLIAGTAATAGAVGTLLFAPAVARHRDEEHPPRASASG